VASFTDDRAVMQGPRNAVASLITAVAVVASLVLWLSAHSLVSTVGGRPGLFGAFVAISIGLQFLSIPVYGHGSIGAQAVGLMASAFILGPGPAAVIAVITALAQWLRTRGLVHRAVFDAANYALSTAAAGWLYSLFAASSHNALVQLGVGTMAGLLYAALNVGLLCLVMSRTEEIPAVDVWRERFQWAWTYFVAFGPIAVASSIAFWQVGWAGFVAFALPPAILIFSIRQSVRRTEHSVTEVRQAKADLCEARAEAENRTGDLATVFHFSAELAACSDDLTELVGYAQYALSMIAGTPVRVLAGEAPGIPLIAGGRQVGAVQVRASGRLDAPRWEHLRDYLIFPLATAMLAAEAAGHRRSLESAAIMQLASL